MSLLKRYGRTLLTVGLALLMQQPVMAAYSLSVEKVNSVDGLSGNMVHHQGWVDLSDRIHDSDPDKGRFRKVPNVPTADNDLRREIRAFFGRKSVPGLVYKGKLRWQQIRRRYFLDYPYMPNYVVDKYRFVGEPVIAKLDIGKKSDLDYYLVILHFNIPVTKGLFLTPFKYNYIRIGTKLFGTDHEDFKDDGSGAPPYVQLFPARTISIYPVNEVVDVNRKDTHKVEAKIEPQYMGAAPGHLQYNYENEQSQIIKLPRVMGTASRFGDVNWTYYPAKWQPVIQGQQTAFTVVGLPREAKHLHLLCHMEYNLKYFKYIPTPMLLFLDCYDTASIDLKKSTISLDDLIKIHVADLPQEIKERIRTEFKTPAPGSKYKITQGPKSSSDFIEFGGQLYSQTEHGATLQPIP
ncbi:MAG: hypothetical protein AB7W16_16440 [Candidatus Obscuribacterales bacterium]